MVRPLKVGHASLTSEPLRGHALGRFGHRLSAATHCGLLDRRRLRSATVAQVTCPTIPSPFEQEGEPHSSATALMVVGAWNPWPTLAHHRRGTVDAIDEARLIDLAAELISGGTLSTRWRPESLPRTCRDTRSVEHQTPGGPRSRPRRARSGPSITNELDHHMEPAGGAHGSTSSGPCRP